jgi:hypothetical protein
MDTPVKRSRAAILGIATLRIGGVALDLAGEGELTGAGGLAGGRGAGVRPRYAARVRRRPHRGHRRHRPRAMMYRGRRPMGMGFSFAMGHSSVVVFPALLIFGGAGQSAKVPSRTSPGLGDSCRSCSPLLPASGRGAQRLGAAQPGDTVGRGAGRKSRLRTRRPEAGFKRPYRSSPQLQRPFHDLDFMAFLPGQ